MSHKHVLITGGAKGIGEACSRIFVKNGYKATFLDIDKDAGHSLQEELGPDGLFVHCDISDTGHVKKAFSEAIQKFGDLDD